MQNVSGIFKAVQNILSNFKTFLKIYFSTELRHLKITLERRYRKKKGLIDINVLMVLDEFAIGGTETHTLCLVKEIRKQGIKVTVIGRNGPLEKKFNELGCKVYGVSIPKSQYVSETILDSIWSEIKQVIISEKINIVHAHQTASGLLALEVAKTLNLASLFTVHGTYYSKKKLIKTMELADIVICVSQPLIKYLQRLGKKDVKLIPNGVDIAEFSPYYRTTIKIKKELNIPEDALIFVYASRLSQRKGKRCMTFLESCKEFRIRNSNIKFEVIVVGDGVLFEKVNELAKEIQKDCHCNFIHLIGESNNEVRNYYSIADCVIGTGRVALEAMSCGVPVIAIGNHGYFGIVESENFDSAWKCYFGDHGSKSPPDSTTLSFELEKLIFSDYSMFIRRDSRKWVEKCFNIEQIGKEIIEVYKSLIQRKL